MASHDIASSVLTLTAAITLMSSRLRREDRGGQLTDIAGSALRQIARLAEDLVDWAAMERGGLRLRRARFDPADLLRETLRGFELRAATKGVRFELILEPDLGLVYGDRRRMAQVIMNLLENALRHTPGGGAVAIGATSAEGNLVIVVRDTGMGMEPAVQRKLENGLSVDKPDGRLGLGLSIARMILACHGGKLWVHSAGLDKGTTFHITIERGRPGAKSSGQAEAARK